MVKRILLAVSVAVCVSGAGMLAASFLGHAFTAPAPLSPVLIAQAERLDPRRINPEAHAARPRSREDVRDGIIQLALARSPLFTGQASRVLSAVSVHNGGTAVLLLCIDPAEAYADARWTCDESRNFITAPAPFIENLDLAAQRGIPELNRFLLSAAVAESAGNDGAAAQYRTARVVFTSPWGGTIDGFLFWGGALAFLFGLLGVICCTIPDRNAGKAGAVAARPERCPTCGGPAPAGLEPDRRTT